MPRTFSLFRLMLGITAFCLLCGLAVNFPELALNCAALLVMCLPSGLIYLVMCIYSRDRLALLGASVVGAVVGLLAAVGPISAFVLPALGTTLVGGSLLLDEFRLRRGKP
jgi:hypothetical protein